MADGRCFVGIWRNVETAGDLTAAVATECPLSESLQAVAKEKATERKARDCINEGWVHM